MKLGNIKTRLAFTTPLVQSLANAWNWWLMELGDMLPRGMRSLIAPGGHYLFLELDGTDFVASQHIRDERIELGRYPLTAIDGPALEPRAVRKLTGRVKEVILCLPRDKVLVKTFSLPLATAENLREVLGFEMDRQTPFSVEQVYYDYFVAAADPKARRLDIIMLLTPRRFLDDLLEKLVAAGLLPDRATACRDADQRLSAVNLLPESRRRRKPALTRIFSITLAVVTGILLLSTVSLPLLNKHLAIRSLESRLDVASARAEVARRLRTEVDRMSAGARYLAEKKKSTQLALEVINEITRILPDDTWITRLDMDERGIQVQGQSLAAAALIPLIESSPMLDNARFRSPVTKIPRAQEERFHLSAEFSAGPSK
jgi:general secretion pathway protein L